MSDVLRSPTRQAAPTIRATGPDQALRRETGFMPPEMVVAEGGYDGSFERTFSYIAPDESLAIGTWASGPGTIVCEAYPSEEYCLVLEGALEVTNHDGERLEFGPGDSFILPKGWKGTWRMKTRFVKQFAVAHWDFG